MPRSAAVRFARSPIDLIADEDHDDMTLADDQPLPVG
jgi:hypothetical protein